MKALFVMGVPFMGVCWPAKIISALHLVGFLSSQLPTYKAMYIGVITPIITIL